MSKKPAVTDIMVFNKKCMMPKVLFIAEHIKQPHGSALSAIDVLRSIPSYFEKYILTDDPIADGDYLHGSVRRSLHAPKLNLKPNFLASILNHLLSHLYPAFIRFWLRSTDFDFVIVNGFGSHSLWKKVLFYYCTSTRTVLISRESPRHFITSDRTHTISDQVEFLKSFDSHIFVSNKLRFEWCNIADLNTKKTFYLPNCCDERSFLSISRHKINTSLVRRQYGLSPEMPLILNVGTIELRKGQQDLEPLALHLRGIGLDFRISCVGFDATKEGTEMRRRIQESDVAKFFIFPGATDRMYDWYEAATLLAFTSRAEAMPRSILEAMASALPIVSTNVDGIPELVDHMIEGYLYNPGNIDELINGVDFFLSNTNRSREIGSNARLRYQATFTQAHHAERFAEIMSKLSIS